MNKYKNIYKRQVKCIHHIVSQTIGMFYILVYMATLISDGQCLKEVMSCRKEICIIKLH